jgi:hypothetical protein
VNGGYSFTKNYDKNINLFKIVRNENNDYYINNEDKEENQIMFKKFKNVKLNGYSIYFTLLEKYLSLFNNEVAFVDKSNIYSRWLFIN